LVPASASCCVEIGDTWIVVGLVPGQIRTLHTLPKGELKPGSDGERHLPNG
jgi:flagellar protein FliO/FliZ